MTFPFPIISPNRQNLPVLRRIAFGLLCIVILAGAAFAEEPAAPPTANRTSGCLERYDPTLDYFPEKATLTHAKGFTLEYFKHYKIVTVTAPWPDAKESFRYVLVQCGAPVPEGFTDAQVIQIPVRSIAILSTTHLPHLELLDALDRLVAVSSYENVYSPAARQLIAAGKVAEVGRGPSVNLERILDLRPDLVTAVGHDQPQYNTHPLLRNAGVNVAINSEYVEPTLLGRSEWLKFTAAFLNRDGLAQRRFAEMTERYEAYAARVRDVPAAHKPSVFGGSLHRDVWYVPGGDSYIARLVADAGGVYRWADDAHRANMAITFGKYQLERGHPLTIFLNDKGVFVGSKAHAAKYAEHQKVLGELMGKGAAVIACPMCMKHYGVETADLLPGIQVGKPEVTGAALFKDGTKTMSW
jgi:iron complex transport system substrate-binding protein